MNGAWQLYVFLKVLSRVPDQRRCLTAIAGCIVCTDTGFSFKIPDELEDYVTYTRPLVLEWITDVNKCTSRFNRPPLETERRSSWQQNVGSYRVAITTRCQ